MIENLKSNINNGYIVPSSIVIGNGKPTDVRFQCDNIADFESMKTTTGTELRYDGLVTYEKSSKRLMLCKANGLNWI